MHTPEEIKKGLECMANSDIECDVCPYRDDSYLFCSTGIVKDAIACIQQLERDKNWASENYDLISEENKRLEAQNAELVRKTEQLKRERDALTNDLYSIVNEHVTPCFCCKTFDPSTTVCEHEGDVDCFTWRGVPEKEENNG